ncbi:hypothetical protein [Demequina mangrovi]|uniref:Uncharacterized protein n=1 Tax=Demequina mangrovi TaxID=1043493 RepID=A0A1H6Z317_9MICO|nr:hypothetical protein [Demequina mangrovi]SEJ46394.1 hypothetical protein SAMN05421637_1873 [Demequina mangrovi]
MRPLVAAMTAAALGAIPLTGCGLEVTICHDLEVTLAPAEVVAGESVEVTVETVRANCADRAVEPSYEEDEPVVLTLFERGSDLISSDVGVLLDEDGHGTATLETWTDMAPGEYVLYEGGFFEPVTERAALTVTAP